MAIFAAAFPAIPAVTGEKGKMKGFVISCWVPAVYTGDDECPEGLAVGPDVEDVLSKYPPKERARLRESGELFSVINRRGPKNTNVCDQPKSVEDPGFRTVQGKIS